MAQKPQAAAPAAPPASPSPFVNRLIGIAEAEWKYFGYQTVSLDGHLTDGHKESEPTYADRVGLYWKAVNANYTGRDDVPWSAAFISWAMKTAGAGSNFPYNPSHSVYINRAIRNRLENKTTAPIVGYRLSERAPALGDLIGYSREDSVHIGYDQAAMTSGFKSHTDIVVEVASDHVAVIGGNVLDSVTKKYLATNAAGLLTDHSKAWFVVIQNNL